MSNIWTRYFLYMIVPMLLVPSLWLSTSQSIAEETKKYITGPFVEEVDSSLRKEIEKKTLEIRERFKISSELCSDIRKQLEIGDLKSKSPYTLDRFRSFFKEVGERAVPVLSEVLTEEDFQIRRNAINALGLLTKPKEYQDEEYAQFEEQVLVPLFIRSLYDRDAEVRAGATANLGGIAFDQRWGFRKSVTPRVLDALKRVVSNEQDNYVLRIAITALARIGRKDLISEKHDAILKEIEREKF